MPGSQALGTGMPAGKIEDLTKSARRLNDAFDTLHQRIDTGRRHRGGAIKTLDEMASNGVREAVTPSSVHINRL